MYHLYRVAYVLHHIIAGICLFKCMTADTTGDYEELYFTAAGIFVILYVGNCLWTGWQKEKLQKELEDMDRIVTEIKKDYPEL